MRMGKSGNHRSFWRSRGKSRYGRDQNVNIYLLAFCISLFFIFSSYCYVLCENPLGYDRPLISILLMAAIYDT